MREKDREIEVISSTSSLIYGVFVPPNPIYDKVSIRHRRIVVDSHQAPSQVSISAIEG